MDQAQVEAEVMAQAGDYAEAMHILLLQSVGELRRRLDVAIAVSLTSREIMHKLELTHSARLAFSDIISRVEISYFGSYLPTQADYLACRESFAALALALGRREQGQ